MILNDFLSQQNNDESDPNEIIPISFDMHRTLENNLEKFSNDKYLVQTHSLAKSSGIKLPEVCGIEKSLNPNLRQEKQHTIPNKGNLERPHIGQGRAGSKRKKPDPINQAINRPSDLSKEIPGRTKNRNKENKQHAYYIQCSK